MAYTSKDSGMMASAEIEKSVLAIAEAEKILEAGIEKSVSDEKILRTGSSFKSGVSYIFIFHSVKYNDSVEKHFAGFL